jgi:hypothetical protein
MSTPSDLFGAGDDNPRPEQQPADESRHFISTSSDIGPQYRPASTSPPPGWDPDGQSESASRSDGARRPPQSGLAPPPSGLAPPPSGLAPPPSSTAPQAPPPSGQSAAPQPRHQQPPYRPEHAAPAAPPPVAPNPHGRWQATPEEPDATEATTILSRADLAAAREQATYDPGVGDFFGPVSGPSTPTSPNNSAGTSTRRSSRPCRARGSSAPHVCSPRSGTAAPDSPPPRRWPAWPASPPPPASPGR